MMAHRILKGYPRSIYRGTKEIKQNFKYLLVMDFEATCEQNGQLIPQEIIEFPCLAVSTEDWEVKNVFHKYIKPRSHPKLSPFCTHLTGITQSMVESQAHFPETFHEFSQWLQEHGYVAKEENSAFVTCGDWDLKIMLPAQCALDNLTLPEHFKKWINLKETFCIAMQYYPRTLSNMLARLDIPLKGRLHSGIDDSENMVKIIQCLHSKYNSQFKITSSLNSMDKVLAKNRAR